MGDTNPSGPFSAAKYSSNPSLWISKPAPHVWTPKLNRHLLYSPWQLSVDNGKSVGPKLHRLLVSCIQPLKSLPNVGPAQPPGGTLGLCKSAKWYTTFQAIWSHGTQPCIETSEHEVAALAFILGMPLRSTDYLPGGVAAFGIGLSPEKVNILPNVRMVYGRRDSRIDPVMGSGYSILFAKHIACGCLPFGIIGKETVQTILVTKQMLGHIKLGNRLVDSYNAADQELEWTPCREYLDELPSAYPNNYFAGTERKDENGNNGEIRDVCKRQVSTWAQSVAGIAFGGLVPMAGVSLIQAVRFTVNDGNGLGQACYFLEHIMSAVHEQTKD
jgi:hypothetical protein